MAVTGVINPPTLLDWKPLNFKCKFKTLKKMPNKSTILKNSLKNQRILLFQTGSKSFTIILTHASKTRQRKLKCCKTRLISSTNRHKLSLDPPRSCTIWKPLTLSNQIQGWSLNWTMSRPAGRKMNRRLERSLMRSCTIYDLNLQKKRSREKNARIDIKKRSESSWNKSKMQ